MPIEIFSIHIYIKNDWILEMKENIKLLRCSLGGVLVVIGGT